MNTAEVDLCFLELCLFHWLKTTTYYNSKENNPDSADINGKIGSFTHRTKKRFIKSQKSLKVHISIGLKQKEKQRSDAT